VLVATVLRPEEREDRELEVVRLALEKIANTVELLVGETEGSMQRLLDDRAQRSMVTATPAGARRSLRAS
jgi:hypothetical protein